VEAVGGAPGTARPAMGYCQVSGGVIGISSLEAVWVFSLS
jgi:hypothetical protein